MPAGFKRSRALWDDTRRPHPNKLEQLRSVLRAVLYELQPIRFSEVDTEGALSVLHSIGQAVLYFLKNVPHWLRMAYEFLYERTMYQWSIVGGVVAYLYVVRFVHE